MDEELAEDYRAELNESDRKLLRPLENLHPAAQKEEPSATGKEPSATGKEPSATGKEPSATRKEPSATRKEPSAPSSAPSLPQSVDRDASGGEKSQEQQQELFDQPAAAPAVENPFLPAHIRARLTGGRVPKTEDRPPEVPARESIIPEEALDTGAGPETEETPVPEPEPTEGLEVAEADPREETDTGTAERELQRQQLIDRLVAKQLPELERQLRARIEAMVDELETF
ncbi:hypothetical protein [Microbulbifer taiwanensis]|uniref:hypothetical protein n=1 Tax=Microbulbifer taiwanensis TaxID=986746 RepID=UPI003623AE53